MHWIDDHFSNLECFTDSCHSAASQSNFWHLFHYFYLCNQIQMTRKMLMFLFIQENRYCLSRFRYQSYWNGKSCPMWWGLKQTTLVSKSWYLRTYCAQMHIRALVLTLSLHYSSLGYHCLPLRPMVTSHRGFSSPLHYTLFQMPLRQFCFTLQTYFTRLSFWSLLSLLFYYE